MGIKRSPFCNQLGIANRASYVMSKRLKRVSTLVIFINLVTMKQNWKKKIELLVNSITLHCIFLLGSYLNHKYAKLLNWSRIGSATSYVSNNYIVHQF